MLAVALNSRTLALAIPALFCAAVAANQILLNVLYVASRRGRWRLNSALLGAVIGEIVTIVVMILVLGGLLTCASLLLGHSATKLAIPYRQSIRIIAVAHLPLVVWACLCLAGLGVAWAMGNMQRDTLAVTLAMAATGRIVAEIAAVALASWAVRRELGVSRVRSLVISALPFAVIHAPDAIGLIIRVLK